jgi:acetyl esterase/lipase
MSSIQSHVYKLLLRLMDSKNKIVKEFASGDFKKRDCPYPPTRLFKGFDIKKSVVNSSNVFTVIPIQERTRQHILYLHGGAYVHNMAKQHWTFIKALSVYAGCSVTIPDYPLAPTYTYKETYQVIMEVYQTLALDTANADLVLMGDSAGGGLALSLAQQLRHLQCKKPVKIILICPWLDLSLTNPAIHAIDKRDPFLGIDGLKMAAKAFAADLDLKNPLISPLYQSLDNMGSISVFAATDDILFADALSLKNKAAQSDIQINYYQYNDMIHDWLLLSMPEAKAARSQIIDLLLN